MEHLIHLPSNYLKKCLGKKNTVKSRRNYLYNNLGQATSKSQLDHTWEQNLYDDMHDLINLKLNNFIPGHHCCNYALGSMLPSVGNITNLNSKWWIKEYLKLRGLKRHEWMSSIDGTHRAYTKFWTKWTKSPTLIVGKGKEGGGGKFNNVMEKINPVIDFDGFENIGENIDAKTFSDITMESVTTQSIQEEPRSPIGLYEGWEIEDDQPRAKIFANTLLGGETMNTKQLNNFGVIIGPGVDVKFDHHKIEQTFRKSLRGKIAEENTYLLKALKDDNLIPGYKNIWNFFKNLYRQPFYLTLISIISSKTGMEEVEDTSDYLAKDQNWILPIGEDIQDDYLDILVELNAIYFKIDLENLKHYLRVLKSHEFKSKDDEINELMETYYKMFLFAKKMEVMSYDQLCYYRNDIFDCSYDFLQETLKKNPLLDVYPIRYVLTFLLYKYYASTTPENLNETEFLKTLISISNSLDDFSLKSEEQWQSLYVNESTMDLLENYKDNLPKILENFSKFLLQNSEGRLQNTLIGALRESGRFEVAPQDEREIDYNREKQLIPAGVGGGKSRRKRNRRRTRRRRKSNKGRKSRRKSKRRRKSKKKRKGKSNKRKVHRRRNSRRKRKSNRRRRNSRRLR